MVKQLKATTWKSVKLEGDIIQNLEGLAGIEECTDYNLGSKVLNSKNRKRKSKNKNKTAHKKFKTDYNANKELVIDDHKEYSDQDLTAWSSYDIPSVLLRAIKEQGFIQPTEIQRLTFPAAIMGRRDILGAAETGSGKTLAFGIPILSGILKLKEMEQCSIQSDKEIFSDNDVVEDDEPESECDQKSEEDDRNVNKNFGKYVRPRIDDEEETEANDMENQSDKEEDDCLDSDSEADENFTGCVNVIDNIKLNESSPTKPLYALILTPTRELAIQVKDHLVAIAKYSGIQVAVVLGGMAVVKQERILKRGPEIVVATPGRLWELIQLGNDHLVQVDKIRFLAIDETDRMLEKGHFQELQDLLERINFNKAESAKRQNFVFSATLTLVHELPKYLALQNKLSLKKRKRKFSNLTPDQKIQHVIELLGINNPKVVDVTQRTGTAETLLESRISCNFDEKDFYVFYFLREHPGRTLIFCNSISSVKRLVTLLNLLGCNTLGLHASMQQRQRLKNLDRFKENNNAVLVATDVAARGLDIPSIEHVIHYQTPRTTESYVHRSGRTARASKEGLTVLLVEPSELQNYVKLCRTLGRSEDLPLFPIQDNILNSIKEIVRLARQLENLQLRLSKNNTESSWLQKAAKEMDIIVDERMYSNGDELSHNEETSSLSKLVKLKKKQLSALLEKPTLPKGFSGKYPLVSTAGEIGINKHKNEKAIDILSSAIANNKNSRKKPKWLFKEKNSHNRESKKLHGVQNKGIAKKKFTSRKGNK